MTKMTNMTNMTQRRKLLIATTLIPFSASVVFAGPGHDKPKAGPVK